MKGKKELLVSCLNSLGILQLLARHNNNSLTVFNYHRIYSPPLNTSYDEGVYAHSEQVFYNQMQWLVKNFSILCEEELIDIIGKRKTIPKRCAMVTFDDGYRDNYDIAYPILKDLRIPAIFFIPYQNIDDGVLGWWDLIAFIINKTKVSSFSFNGNNFILRNEEDRKSTTYQLLKYFKGVDHDKSTLLVGSLSDICDVALPETTTQKKELMTWDQIIEVSQSIIDIGPHTMTHRILSRLDYNDQVWEISESKIKLQEKLGIKIKSIAYPVGGEHAFTEETKEITAKEGYKLGFSFYNGYQKGINIDSFNIKRIELGQISSLYKAQSIIPSFF